MATLDRAKVAQAQREDEWCKRVVHCMTTKSDNKGDKKDDDEDVFMKKEAQLCKMREGLLYRMQKGKELLVIPKAQRGCILDELHSSLFGGHLGVEHTVTHHSELLVAWCEAGCERVHSHVSSMQCTESWSTSRGTTTGTRAVHLQTV